MNKNKAVQPDPIVKACTLRGNLTTSLTMVGLEVRLGGPNAR